jgi:hypothetical protein
LYIETVYKEGKNRPDTLFIGLNDEFPEIKLPAAIRSIPLKLVSIEESTQNLRSGRETEHVNVIGWRNKDRSKFILITFFTGGRPQHNFHIKFTHDPLRKEIKTDTLYFEYAYSKK